MTAMPGAEPEENGRQEERPSAPAAENTHGTPSSCALRFKSRHSRRDCEGAC